MGIGEMDGEKEHVWDCSVRQSPLAGGELRCVV